MYTGLQTSSHLANTPSGPYYPQSEKQHSNINPLPSGSQRYPHPQSPSNSTSPSSRYPSGPYYTPTRQFCKYMRVPFVCLEMTLWMDRSTKIPEASIPHRRLIDKDLVFNPHLHILRHPDLFTMATCRYRRPQERRTTTTAKGEAQIALHLKRNSML